jgi:hypothetical protein
MLKSSDTFNYKFTLKTVTEAIKWFKIKVQALQHPTSEEIQKKEKDITSEDNGVDVFEVGKMYLFHYDPKGKVNLPYYDMFPLILMMGKLKGGFYGINLHYLPINVRMILLSRLIEKAILKDGELERLRISYDIVKNETTFQAFKPCFKRYSFLQIKSSIKLIDPADWVFAASLPIENFKKKTKQQIWKESMDSLN